MKNAPRGKRTGFRKKRGAKKPCRVSKCVKKYVKRALHANVENKQIVVTNINQTITTVSAAVPTFVSLIGQISQGNTSNTRVGNQVKCVKGIIRGYLNYLPYNVSTNPQSAPLWVKMWLVSPKAINTNVLSSTVIATDFFDLGGAVGSFSGNMRDIIVPVNTEFWTVYATKTAKIGFSSQATGGTPISTQTWYDNSPFTVPFTFNYGKHLKQVLKFNDASPTCTNRSMFLILQAVYADGTNTAITAAEYHYSNEFKYEDA